MAFYVRYRALGRQSNSANPAGKAGVRLPSAIGLVYPAGDKAVRTTAMTGANNDITITAKYGGTWAHNLSFELLDPSTSSTGRSIARTFTGNAIKFSVTLAVDGSSNIATTETATSVVASLNADPVFASYATAAVKSGDTGAGVVTALSEVALAAGTNVGASEPLFVTVDDVTDIVVDIQSRVTQRYLQRWFHRLVNLGAV